MRILKSSILLYKIKPKTDVISCYFIFFISLFCWKIEKRNINLKELNVKQTIKYYQTLADEWNAKYRI